MTLIRASAEPPTTSPSTAIPRHQTQVRTAETYGPYGPYGLFRGSLTTHAHPSDPRATGQGGFRCGSAWILAQPMHWPPCHVRHGFSGTRRQSGGHAFPARRHAISIARLREKSGTAQHHTFPGSGHLRHGFTERVYGFPIPARACRACRRRSPREGIRIHWKSRHITTLRPTPSITSNRTTFTIATAPSDIESPTHTTQDTMPSYTTGRVFWRLRSGSGHTMN